MSRSNTLAALNQTVSKAVVLHIIIGYIFFHRYYVTSIVITLTVYIIYIYTHKPFISYIELMYV